MFFTVVASSAEAVTCDFTGADWNTGGDWSCAHVPTTSDVAVLDGVFDQAHVGAAPPDVGDLQMINGGTLIFDADVTLHTTAGTGTNGRLTAGSGTLSGTGTLRVGDALVLTGGTNELIVGNSVNLVVDGASSTLDHGSICLSSFGSTMTINHLFTIANGADQSAFNCGNGTLHVAATGELRSTRTTNTTFLEAQFDNDGTVAAAAGTLQFDGSVPAGGSEAGIFRALDNTTNPARLIIHSNQTLAAAGSITTTGNGTFEVAPFSVVSLAAGAGFTPLIFEQTGGSIQLDGTGAVSLPSYSLTGGTFTSTRPVSATNFVAGAGTLGGDNVLKVVSGGNFTRTSGSNQLVITGTEDFVLDNASSTLDNGSICLSSFGSKMTINHLFTVANGADQSAFNCGNGTLTIATGGELKSTRTTNATGMQPVVHNDGGTIRASAGVELDINGQMTQTAGATVVEATATLGGGGDKNISGGTLTVDGTLSGATTLTGTGVLRGGGHTANVTNTSGTVKPGSSPGTLTVDGSFTQGTDGTLDIDVTGTTPGTGFDQLIVNGAATLAGTVHLIQGVGYEPDINDTFRIMKSTSRSGAFDSITGNVTPGNKTYGLEYPVDSDFGAQLVLAPSPPPVNQTPPSIIGTPAVGQTLTCDPGGWTNSPGFTFEWLSGGTPISGATQSTYLVTSSDQGHQITCRVSATNSGGSGQASSAPATIPVIPPPDTAAPPDTGAPPSLPANTAPPTLPSSGRTGDTLTCNPGTWTGNPTFAFQWLRDGNAIAGATSATYGLTDADLDHNVSCSVSATNAGGSTIRVTNAILVLGARVEGQTLRGEEAFTQGTANDLALACTKLDLLLVDVLPKGAKKVSIIGAADERLVGNTLDILLGTKRVGSAVIQKGGSFAATVAAPAAKARRNAQYQASAGATKSQKLHLERRMIATTLVRSGANIVLTGVISKPFAKKPVPIRVQRYLSCQQREDVKVSTVVPDSRGRFSLKFPAPTGVRSAIYRALTKVATRTGGPANASTFTLPRAIEL